MTSGRSATIAYRTGPRKALSQMLCNALQPQLSIVAAIEAVMVVMVMMVMTISARYDDDTRLIIKSTVLAVVMVVMVVIELRLLNIFIGGRDRTGFIDDLKQGRRVRNRLKQVSK